MRLRNLIALLFVCLLGVQALSIAHFLDEERYLSDLMDRIAPRTLPPSEQAIKVVELLKEMPDIDNPSYFLLPIFGFLRATPRQVMEQGGECGDRSRLVIRLLNVRGIKASKWALYTREMKSVHAVVELEVETGKMVVDPLFGLWFPRVGGGYYGIRELRQSPEILKNRVQSLVQEGKHPGTSDLHGYPFEQYSYEHAKTINWDKGPGMWAIYNALRRISGPSVDHLPRPAFVEAPQLMVLIIAALLQSCLLALYFVLGRRIDDSRLLVRT